MNSPLTQILAAFLILFSLVKLIVVFRNPLAWIAFARRVYANPKVTTVAALVAAGLILCLLIRSGLDIVQILAVGLFVACLMVVGIAPYAKDLFAWLERQDLAQLIRRQWLYIALWIFLLSWGAYRLVAS